MDRVLAAVDGSEHALRAVRLAAGLAARYGAELHPPRPTPTSS